MIKRNLLANYIGQAWTSFISIVFVPFYLQFLGVEAYGLIGFFVLLSNWLLLLDMGMTPTMSREMASFSAGKRTNESIRDLLRSVEILAVIISLLIFISIYFTSSNIALYWIKAKELSVKTVSQSVVLMGLIVALKFLESIYRSVIIGLQKHVFLNIFNVVLSTLRGFGAVIVLAYFSPTIQAFFLWNVFISVLTLFIFNIYIYRSIPHINRTARFSINELLAVRKFATGIIGITLVTLILTQVDKVLLSRFLTLSEFGNYNILSLVAGVLVTLLGPITTTFYPKFSELYALNREFEISETFHKAAQLVTVIIGPLSVIMIFYSELIFKLWLHDSSFDSSSLFMFRLMVISNLLISLWYVPHQFQLATGWTKLTVYFNTIATFLIVPSLLFLIPLYGVIGSVFVNTLLHISYLTIAAFLFFRMRLIGEKWRWYKEDILYPFCGALVGVVFIKLFFLNCDSLVTNTICLILSGIFSVSLSMLSATRIRKILKSYISKRV